MILTIKTNKELCKVLEGVFIKMHDEFLSANKDSVFDWFCEAFDDNLAKYTISFEGLSKDDVQYMMETLEYLERNLNG